MEDITYPYTLSTSNSATFSTIVRGLDFDDPPNAAVPAIPKGPEPTLPGAMALELVHG
jgi:hypothetical protein